MRENTIRPAAVVVSIPSVNDRNPDSAAGEVDDGGQQMLQRAAKPVQLPHDQGARGRTGGEQLVELRAAG
jgi:hypothetical protein